MMNDQIGSLFRNGSPFQPGLGLAGCGPVRQGSKLPRFAACDNGIGMRLARPALLARGSPDLILMLKSNASRAGRAGRTTPAALPGVVADRAVPPKFSRLRPAC